MLDYKNKFEIRNPRRPQSYCEQDFFNWSNNNMYRTSYNDMSHKGVRLS